MTSTADVLLLTLFLSLQLHYPVVEIVHLEREEGRRILGELEAQQRSPGRTNRSVVVASLGLHMHDCLTAVRIVSTVQPLPLPVS